MGNKHDQVVPQQHHRFEQVLVDMSTTQQTRPTIAALMSSIYVFPKALQNLNDKLASTKVAASRIPMILESFASNIVHLPTLPNVLLLDEKQAQKLININTKLPLKEQFFLLILRATLQNNDILLKFQSEFVREEQTLLYSLANLRTKVSEGLSQLRSIHDKLQSLDQQLYDKQSNYINEQITKRKPAEKEDRKVTILSPFKKMERLELENAAFDLRNRLEKYESKNLPSVIQLKQANTELKDQILKLETDYKQEIIMLNSQWDQRLKELARNFEDSKACLARKVTDRQRQFQATDQGRAETITKLKRDIDSANQQLSTARSKIVLQTCTIEQLGSSLAAAKKDLRVSTELISARENELLVLRSQFERLKKDYVGSLKATQESNTRLSDEITKHKAKNNELELSIRQLESQLEITEKKLVEENNQQLDKETSLSKLKLLVEQNSVLRKQVREAETHRRSISEQSKFDQDQLIGSKQQLQQRLENTRKQLTEFRNIAQESEKELKRLAQQLFQLKDSQEKLKEKTKEADAESKQLREHSFSQDNLIETLKRSNVDLQRSLDEQSKSLSSTLLQCKDAQAENNRIHARLSEANQRSARMERQKQSIYHEYKKLKLELLEMQTFACEIVHPQKNSLLNNNNSAKRILQLEHNIAGLSGMLYDLAVNGTAVNNALNELGLLLKRRGSAAQRRDCQIQTCQFRTEDRQQQTELAPTSETISTLWTDILGSEDKLWLIDVLAKQVGQPVRRFYLKMIASQHMFNPTSYHRICDKLTNHLTIIKTGRGFCIGGFCNLPLGVDGKHALSFIFSVNRRVYMPLKKGKRATQNDSAYGPVFGSDNDIRVDDNTVYTNYHVYLNSFEKLEIEGVPTRQIMLGEDVEDTLLEYEVFTVQFE